MRAGDYVLRLALQEASGAAVCRRLPHRILDLRRRFYFLLHRQRQRTQGIERFRSSAADRRLSFNVQNSLQNPTKWDDYI